jgi:hypothetical protein
MTTITLFPARLSPSTRISWRVAALVALLVVAVLCAVWRRTVPPGPMPSSDVDRDTMCLISRIGLPCRQ